MCDGSRTGGLARAYTASRGREKGPGCSCNRAVSAARRLDAVLRAPVVTAESLAESIGVTPRAALQYLQQLTAAGILREVTGRASWRAYALI